MLINISAEACSPGMSVPGAWAFASLCAMISLIAWALAWRYRPRVYR